MDDRREIDNGAAAACPKDLPDDIFIRLFLRSLARSLSKGEKWVKNATLLAKCTGEEMECESLLAFSAKNVTSELNEGAIICDVPYEGGP